MAREDIDTGDDQVARLVARGVARIPAAVLIRELDKARRADGTYDPRRLRRAMRKLGVRGPLK